VVDVGSGVTFFPWAVARLGYRVTCADIDSVCGIDIPKACQIVSPAPGVVDFRLIQDDSLPFKDGEADAIYCVSVLEHVPEMDKLISEMARVLKPGKLLLLTIDLDLSGGTTIGPESFEELRRKLTRYFLPAWPEITIHPLHILTPVRGPYAEQSPGHASELWFHLKQCIKPLFGRTPSTLVHDRLAVHGLALLRR
jgi:ubiquinone/menaquinone biosynthesis C-methylase UbiE